MYDLTHIKNYLLFLKTECDLSVTLHMNGLDTLVYSSDLMYFNIHDNPYCIYIKSCRDAHLHCIKSQKRVEEKTEKGSYEGVCYAGVREYVYPIKNRNDTVGFICVSGYKTKNANEYIDAVANKHGLDTYKLRAAYNFLKEEMPDKAKADTLIIPLLNMLELAYSKADLKRPQQKNFADMVVEYLNRYHTENITSEDICRHFSCSRSYLSHEFNKTVGKSIKQYLTEIRLRDAKSLLQYSPLSVTEIAFSVGYGDSNYFSSLFKKHTGVSPAEYRKNNN